MLPLVIEFFFSKNLQNIPLMAPLIVGGYKNICKNLSNKYNNYWGHVGPCQARLCLCSGMGLTWARAGLCQTVLATHFLRPIHCPLLIGRWADLGSLVGGCAWYVCQTNQVGHTNKPPNPLTSLIWGEGELMEERSSVDEKWQVGRGYLECL